MPHTETEETVYSKYGPQLYAYAKRFIPDDPEAVRLIIEWAFTQYEKKPDKVIMTDKAIGIYLRLIARNLITNYFHSKVSHATQKHSNVG